MDFEEWHNKLQLVNMDHNEYGMQYPMGSCCYRDVIRDPEVVKALRNAWNKYVIEGEADE